MTEIIKSEKEKDLLINDGFCYRIGPNKTSWGCIKDGCLGRAHTVLEYHLNLASFELQRIHTHERDIIDILKKRRYIK